jgi:hypothetical protein
MTTLDLPRDAGREQDAAILDRITNNRFDPIPWAWVTSTWNGHTGEFEVFADALKMDGVRIGTSAEVAQKIADTLHCSLLTPKIADLLWAQKKVAIPPFTRGRTEGMSTTDAMIEHSAKIDKALADRGNPEGLLATVGKHWVLDNDLVGKKGPEMGGAINYGWHFEGPTFEGKAWDITASRLEDAKGSYVRMIQAQGHRHDFRHSDYSQTVILVALSCVIDGETSDIQTVLQDPELAGLVSHQGALRVIRQPGT